MITFESKCEMSYGNVCLSIFMRENGIKIATPIFFLEKRLFPGCCGMYIITGTDIYNHEGHEEKFQPHHWKEIVRLINKWCNSFHHSSIKYAVYLTFARSYKPGIDVANINNFRDRYNSDQLLKACINHRNFRVLSNHLNPGHEGTLNTLVGWNPKFLIRNIWKKYVR